MKPGARALPALALVLLLGGALWHARAGAFHEDVAGHALGTDDAFISYRYARHLWRGQGLVFNPGQRVEGYSNLLFVLLMAPAFAVTDGEGAYRWALGLNLLLAAGAFAVHHVQVRRHGGPPAAVLASFLMAACPVAWLWVASGMETALVLLLQVALWALVSRATEPLGGEGHPSVAALAAVTVALVLARADGFVGPVLAAVYLALRGRRRAAVAVAATAVLALSGLVGWRLLYYGQALPNTFHAKVSGPMLERCAAALWQLRDLAFGYAGLGPYLLALLAALVLPVLRRPRQVPAFGPAFAAGWLLYWIWVGGDVFGERFLLILVPLGAAEIARFVLAPGRRLTLLAAAAVALAFVWQAWPLAADRRFRYGGGPRYDRWVELGRVLAPEAARGRTLAVCAAGKVPYFSGLPAIDMLGLTDAHIARVPTASFRVGHSKHDPGYVLGRRPDLIATWIDGERNLRWGLTRERWEAAGYRLKYLAFARRRRPERPVLDVSRMDAGRVGELIGAGYQYAVIERVPPP